MKRIVIGGQLNKDRIASEVEEKVADQAEVKVMSDLDAAMAVKNGDADYYIGACETGAGGALAMATALLGSDKTVTVASPSKMLSNEEIESAVQNGKVAFGFTQNATETVLPVIVESILKK